MLPFVCEVTTAVFNYSAELLLGSLITLEKYLGELRKLRGFYFAVVLPVSINHMWFIRNDSVHIL